MWASNSVGKDSLFRNKIIQATLLKDCKIGALFKPITKSVPNELEQKTKILYV